MQHFGDLFAFGQQQAVLPGDDLKADGSHRVYRNTHADGQAAEDQTAGNAQPVQQLQAAGNADTHDGGGEKGLSQIFHDGGGIFQNTAHGVQVQHRDAQEADHGADGGAHDANVGITGEDVNHSQPQHAGDEHVDHRHHLHGKGQYEYLSYQVQHPLLPLQAILQR